MGKNKKDGLCVTSRVFGPNIQEMILVKETLWNSYTVLLSSYTYYASLDGAGGETDSLSHRLDR